MYKLYMLYKEKKELDRRKKGTKLLFLLGGGGQMHEMIPKKLDLYAVSFNDETV
jgi:hypothetical protein